MELLDRIAAERECERLTYRYCEAVDLGHASRLADVFARGRRLRGRRTAPGRPGARSGGSSPNVSGSASCAPATSARTCTSTSSTRPTATGVVYLTLYRRRGSEDWSVPVPHTAPAVVGSYHDRYVLTSDGWRIASRHQQVVFVDPTDAGVDHRIGHDLLPLESS